MAEKMMEKNPLLVTEKGMAVIEALRAGDGITAKELAERMGVTPQSVNGTFTSLSTRRANNDMEPIGVREEIVLEDEEGKKATVKLLKLTDFGKTAEFEVAAGK